MEDVKFGIITYILHKYRQGRYNSYAPYVAEMNIWMKYSKQTLIAAPKVWGSPSSIEVPYSKKRINFYEVPVLNFSRFRKFFISTLRLPRVAWRVWMVMKKSNHIHLRCPGNVSLIGCFLQIFHPRKPKTAKYAGNWDPDAQQPLSYKLQKWILNNTFLSRNIQVLVYGEWPGQSINVKPFFTASFSENEISKVADKNFEGSFTFLFVGSLVSGKQPLKAIKIVQRIRKELHREADAPLVRLEIYGDGPDRAVLEAYSREQKLEDLVTFKGNRSLEELKVAYKDAHFLVLPSKSEGWPKAVAEAMFFGCIPIATPVSCVPWMLGNGSRGLLLSEFIWDGNSSKNSGMEDLKITSLLNDSQAMENMSRRARKWSQRYTLEKLEEAIKEVLSGPNKAL